MTIELTEKQQAALDAREDELPQVVDPPTNATYVLVAAEEYESIREILEDERRQRAIRAVALRNAAVRMADAP